MRSLKSNEQKSQKEHLFFSNIFFTFATSFNSCGSLYGLGFLLRETIESPFFKKKIMKKIILFCGVAMALASCTTIKQTATTANVPSQLLTATVADLEVSPQRVSTEYFSTAEVRRGGVSNVLHAAEQKLLAEKAPGYDLLVEPEYTTERVNYFIFGSKVTKVKVSGRPAKYKNFRSLNDSVWCNPVFRTTYKDNTAKGTTGLKKLLGK